MRSSVLATAALNYSPNSFFLCVTLLWSRTVPARLCASTELLLETQGKGWEQLGREGAMAEPGSQQGTAQRQHHHGWQPLPASATPGGSGRY